MIYKNFQGIKLSALGMGAMRLPVIDGDDSKIDVAHTAEMVKYAIEHGVNYFDTAWGYHSGNSELVMGEVLSAYPRESFYLASKFPGFNLENMSKVKEIFERQLEKCRVDYFDFYLFHNLCEMNLEWYLDSKYGLFDYLIEQKENGRIRHLGFSTHGSVATIRRFLEKYGHAMEFGQLQLNWFDWDFQSAKEKYELLKEYNIPVWVMEPLRGGRLCKLDDSHIEKLNALRPNETVPAWAFRFIQGLDAVGVTLSGMSNYEQMVQNIATFETDAPLNEAETAAISEIAKDRIAKTALRCTACRYCTSYCPQGLDIPRLIELYNERSFPKDGAELSSLDGIESAKMPSACIGCRSCEEVCPQGIRISEMMIKFDKILK